MSSEPKWKSTEEKIKEMMKADRARTVPGSGNGKGEEDVIGFSTIIQCKFSDKKNITILAKDITRLKEAATLQGKTPLFASENNNELVISLPEGKHLPSVLELLISISQLEKIQEDLKYCSDISTWNAMNDFYEKVAKRVSNQVINLLRKKQEEIVTKLKCKYDDLTQVDLFAQEN